MLSSPFTTAAKESAEAFASYARKRGDQLQHDFGSNGIFLQNYGEDAYANLLDAVDLLQDCPSARNQLVPWLNRGQFYNHVENQRTRIHAAYDRILSDLPELHDHLTTNWTNSCLQTWLTPKKQERLIPSYLKKLIIKQLADHWYQVINSHYQTNNLHLWTWLDQPLPEIEQAAQVSEDITRAIRRREFRKIAGLCALCPALARAASKSQKDRFPLLERLHDFFHKTATPTAAEYQQLLKWPFATNPENWPFDIIGLHHKDAIQHQAKTTFNWPALGETRTARIKGVNAKIEIGHTYIKAVEKEITYNVACRITDKVVVVYSAKNRINAAVHQWLEEGGQQIYTLTSVPKHCDNPQETLQNQADNYLRHCLCPSDMTGWSTTFSIGNLPKLLEDLGTSPFTEKALEEALIVVRAIENRYIYEMNFPVERPSSQRDIVNQLKQLTELLPGYEMRPEILVTTI